MSGSRGPAVCKVARDTLYSPPMSQTPVIGTSRRHILKKASVVLGAGAITAMARTTRAQSNRVAPDNRKHPFTYYINTSTISGHKVPLAREIELAAKAGYTAMEPWIREVNEHTKNGGTLADLKKRFADHGIAVPNAIGFVPWIVGDDEARKRSLDAMKRDMDLVAQIGG